MVRAVDKADAMLTLSSALVYNIGSHLPFIYFSENFYQTTSCV